MSANLPNHIEMSLVHQERALNPLCFWLFHLQNKHKIPLLQVKDAGEMTLLNLSPETRSSKAQWWANLKRHWFTLGMHCKMESPIQSTCISCNMHGFADWPGRNLPGNLHMHFVFLLLQSGKKYRKYSICHHRL